MTGAVLSHIEMNVEDLGKSVEFWGWLLTRLGYEEYQSWNRGRSWRLKDTYIVLVQVDDAYKNKSYHRKQVGLNHLAFRASAPEEVDRLMQELRDRNVTLLYDERYPSAAGKENYAVFFEDPNRIKLEYVCVIQN